MPVAIIIQIITWIIENPALIIQGEQAVMQLVNDVIDIWRRWNAGVIGEHERDAAWAAAGVDMQAVRDHWRTRHPVAAPTAATSAGNSSPRPATKPKATRAK